MEIILVDTSILINILRGINDPIKAISDKSFAINSIVYMELLRGAKNKLEIPEIEKFLKSFQIIHINENISKISLKLIKNYSKSHNLMIPDSIIAATCLEYDFKLLTLNLKDFKFIPNLKLYDGL